MGTTSVPGVFLGQVSPIGPILYVERERTVDNGKPNTTKHEYKSMMVDSIFDYLIGKYREESGAKPQVFWWREVVREYFQKKHGRNPLHHETKETVSRHLKRHKQLIEDKFEREGYDIVMIATPPKEGVLKHGGDALVDENADEDFYVGCIPAIGKPMMGFIIFPPGAEEHPAVVWTRRKRIGQATAHLVSSIKRADHSAMIGTMSDINNEEVKAKAEWKCIDAFHRHTLLDVKPTPRKAIGRNAPKHTPESDPEDPESES